MALNDELTTNQTTNEEKINNLEDTNDEYVQTIEEQA